MSPTVAEEGKMWSINTMSVFSYWAGDDADVFGILFEPIVHVLTHGKQVVKAGSLTRRPVAFWHLGHEKRGNGKVRKNGTTEGGKDS